jgi:hypothetical protein
MVLSDFRALGIHDDYFMKICFIGSVKLVVPDVCSSGCYRRIKERLFDAARRTPPNSPDILP